MTYSDGSAPFSGHRFLNLFGEELDCHFDTLREALESHPVAGRGLIPFTLCRVLQSEQRFLHTLMDPAEVPIFVAILRHGFPSSPSLEVDLRGQEAPVSFGEPQQIVAEREAVDYTAMAKILGAIGKPRSELFLSLRDTDFLEVQVTERIFDDKLDELLSVYSDFVPTPRLELRAKGRVRYTRKLRVDAEEQYTVLQRFRDVHYGTRMFSVSGYGLPGRNFDIFKRAFGEKVEHHVNRQYRRDQLSVRKSSNRKDYYLGDYHIGSFSYAPKLTSCGFSVRGWAIPNQSTYESLKDFSVALPRGVRLPRRLR